MVNIYKSMERRAVRKEQPLKRKGREWETRPQINWSFLHGWKKTRNRETTSEVL